MKQLIGHDIGNFVFSPSTRQVVLVGIPAITLAQVLTIVNVTDGIMIYCFADPSLGGSEVNNIITLNYDTTGMLASDDLQIYVDLPSTAAADAAQAIDDRTHILLQRIADLLEPMATQDVANRQRVSVDAFPATVPTVTTVGTVSTITGGTITTITNAVPVGNVATLGLVDPRFMFIELARHSYNTGPRSGLAFS